MSGDSGNERASVFARGIPSVRTNVVEAQENRQIVEQSVIAFVGSFVLLFVGWVVLNTAAYSLVWLWDFVVRASMIAPAYLAALWVSVQLTRDLQYSTVIRMDGRSPYVELIERSAIEQALASRSAQRWATVVGFLVWWFLAGDPIIKIPLPIGDIARYLVVSLNLPEGAELGTFMVSMWRSVSAMAFVSGFVALMPLIGRMRAEMRDRYHAPVEVAIREAEWRIEKERSQFNIDLAERCGLEIGDGGGVVIQPTRYAGPPLASSRRKKALPPAPQKVLFEEQPVVGVRGFSKRVSKDVDVSPENATYFILEVESGHKSLTRSSWAGDPIISMTEWDAMIDVLNKAGAIDRKGKTLSVPSGELLKKLHLTTSNESDQESEEQEDQE